MDATRQFKYTVYCPMDNDGFINDEVQLSLDGAWAYYLGGGGSLFMACDALSLEHNSCVLDMEDLTVNEYEDLLKSLNLN